MGGTSVGEIKKHVKIYVMVFIALLALTLITVTISSLRLGIAAAVIVALIIAVMKGSLVASYFMHLITEKKVVYLALILTAVFLLALLFLPLTTYYDRIGK
ncbi:MAG: cytochrome C oxidase subunit IV family protein [Bacteroidota bacterium]